MKIVLNRDFGGFGVSEDAVKMLSHDAYYYDVPEHRTDSELVDVVEKMGEDASGIYAVLKVVNVPDNCTDWEINDYDGRESVTYVVDGKIYHV